MMASYYGHEGCLEILLDSEATVNDTDVSLERALPQAHAVGQLQCSDFNDLLSPVFRTTDGQLCITRYPTAASRSPSVSSNEVRIRRSKTRGARRPSTTHGSMARARSSPC